jgi:low temperature requirement protein LtrA
MTTTSKADAGPVPGSDPEATPLELFFDLVFVFAVSQLTHHLIDHLSWPGGLETLVLLVPVFSSWAATSWNASLPDMGRRHETIAIVVVMPLGLVMNAGIGGAFEEAPWLFAAPFLLCHQQRGVTPLASARSPVLREHFTRQLAWILTSTILWVGGALAAPQYRVGWWGAAALIDLAGTWSGHWIPGHRFRSAAVPFTAGHMIERSRAFLLIALGEGIVTTGAALAEKQVTPARAQGHLMSRGRQVPPEAERQLCPDLAMRRAGAEQPASPAADPHGLAR